MRCNIACTYCYWFRDSQVYNKPKFLSEQTQSALISRLTSYIKKHHLREFEVIFHGGEPLLFGKNRFNTLCQELRIIEKVTKCNLLLSITTNALLIDDEWIALFKKYKINIGVSVDGPQVINDKYRVDFKGKGTYNKVKNAIKKLQANDLYPGILAVCQPENTNISELCEAFINELNVTRFDFLIPDATFHDNPLSISNFYKKLFDAWYDNYSHKNVFITIIECFIRGILGYPGLSNVIGYTPVKTITVLTDGTLEPLDYLRIAENNLTESKYNVFNNELDELQKHSIWKEVYSSSLKLHEKCERCKFRYACGGGPLVSRWKNDTRFNNPSVYCQDLYNIFDYISSRINKDLYIAHKT